MSHQLNHAKPVRTPLWTPRTHRETAVPRAAVVSAHPTYLPPHVVYTPQVVRPLLLKWLTAFCVLLDCVGAAAVVPW